MSFLRSRVLLVLVSLLFLAGYHSTLLGSCCGHEHEAAAEQGTQVPAQQPDDCQCLCHTPLPSSLVEPAVVKPFSAGIAEVVLLTDEFPPDVMPLGIDHPPQLA